ncbi:MAG TPA: AAA family ATPase [Terracidiphilus sp.]
MPNSQTNDRLAVDREGYLQAAGSNQPMDSDSCFHSASQHLGSTGGGDLSIVLMGPDEQCRAAFVRAVAGWPGCDVQQIPSYPSGPSDLTWLLDKQPHVILIDLDSDPERALRVVEDLSSKATATVMVYSAEADSERIVRSMRAGAREFLTIPFEPESLSEALIRAAARHQATPSPKKASGRLLPFMGAKGGAGVTLVALNFAVALARESGESTLLIDLDLPLGDAALNLGIVAEYSTISALQAFDRLDSSFLNKLLIKHSSGVSVLAAPGRFVNYHPTNEALDKLLTVARQDFSNVVVDVGSRLDLTGTSMFRDASAVYLVTQVAISDLRNSNRLISQFFGSDGPKLEIVINRHEPRVLGVSDEQITKALTRPARWHIPNDYAAAQQMQISAAPLTLSDTPISRQIRKMARSAAGLPEVTPKKKGFSLFK